MLLAAVLHGTLHIFQVLLDPEHDALHFDLPKSILGIATQLSLARLAISP